METVTDFIFLGYKITAEGDCSHQIKRHLLLGKTSRWHIKKPDITWLTKVYIVKVIVFPVVMQICELDHKEG